jgi:hypothetical protein
VYSILKQQNAFGGSGRLELEQFISITVFQYACLILSSKWKVPVTDEKKIGHVFKQQLQKLTQLKMIFEQEISV